MASKSTPRIIDALVTSAKQLNEVSDSLNETISLLNERLAATDIGIALWLERPIDPGYAQWEEGEHEGKTSVTDCEIGYCRADGQWQIAYRHVEYFEEPDGYGGTAREYVSVGVPKPLLDGSRALRLKACGLFEQLVIDLKDQSDRYIRSVEDAKKLVNSLL